MTIVPIAAPPGKLDNFMSPSPDRVAAGTPLPTGGATLTDELLITLGTPETPGDRAGANAAAAAAGAVVSGGLDDLGVYEIRWTTPQDLTARRAQLLARPEITAVSDSNVGIIGENAEQPSDWSDDGPQAIWPFTQVRAQQAWDRTTGSDITVGVVDTGVALSDHEDLNVTKKLGRQTAQDHATHVAGLACAKANGIGLVGMAWGCPIVTRGLAEQSSIAAVDESVLESATDVAKQPGVKVVNMSLGYKVVHVDPHATSCATTEQQAALLELARNAKPMFDQLFGGEHGRNIVWTIAAGNNCSAGTHSGWGAHAARANVVTVAATNSDKQLARFSNFGAGVEVAAPGGVSVGSIGNGTVGIWSTWTKSCGFLGLSRCGTYAAQRPQTTNPISGTSMAAPLVAGIAALVRSAHPDYSADRAARCITGTAGADVGTVASRSELPAGPRPHIDYAPAVLPIVNAQAAVECPVLLFDGSPGTGAPPGKLGPHTMTRFGPDQRGDDALVSGVDDPAGTLAFTPAVRHRRVPSSWTTWSHGYTGDVYFSERSSLVIDVPGNPKAFYFYAEPNRHDVFTVEATAQDGTESWPIMVDGNSGARYFGFYATGAARVASITVNTSAPSGFGVGEFGIAR